MYILDNEKLYPKLNFNYESRIEALLNNGFLKIDPSQEIDYNKPILVGVFGHPLLKTQTPQFKNQSIKIINRFKKVFVLIEDMHSYTFSNLFSATGWTSKYTTILTYNMCQEAKNFKVGKWMWIPHHIDLSIFSNFNLERNIDILCYGSIANATYPERYKLVELYNKRVHVIPHPGYHELRHEINKKALASTINRAQHCIVCPSIYQYSVAKYLEIAACGSIMIGQSCKDIDKIGFIINQNAIDHNINIVQKYGLDNFVKRIKECLI